DQRVDRLAVEVQAGVAEGDPELQADADVVATEPLAEAREQRRQGTGGEQVEARLVAEEVGEHVRLARARESIERRTVAPPFEGEVLEVFPEAALAPSFVRTKGVRGDREFRVSMALGERLRLPAGQRPGVHCVAD